MQYANDDIMPTPEDFVNDYYKWCCKWRKNQSAALCGVALNWEWKRQRNEYFKACPHGEGTVVWPPQFYFAALIYRDLKITDRDQLVNMHPSRKRKHADHDWWTLQTQLTSPAYANRNKSIKAEHPDLNLRDKDAVETKEFWQELERDFEDCRTQYMNKTAPQLTKGIGKYIRFFGTGGWKQCFVIDTTLKDDRTCKRPGTILRWRRDRQDGELSGTRWDKVDMKKNIVEFGQELEMQIGRAHV